MSKNAESWYTLSLTPHCRVDLIDIGERLSIIFTLIITDRLYFARVARGEVLHVSASFSATVDGPLLLLEPECNLAWRFGCCAYLWFGHIFPVEVMNMSDENMWLRPRKSLGVLTQVDSVISTELYEVYFQRISTDNEQVSISKHHVTLPDVRSILGKLNVEQNNKHSWL